MKKPSSSSMAKLRRHGRSLRDDQGAQVLEFALSLPLLVLFVIGIFDFSSAITLKQKLANAAREGARVAAADPASDLTSGGLGGLPASVYDAFWVVSNYLASENINDCGLSTIKPVASGTLTWVATATGCGAGSSSLRLTINRGCVTSATTLSVVGTCVTIQYPYKWQFNSIAGVVGKNFAGPTSITTTATAFNEN